MNYKKISTLLLFAVAAGFSASGFPYNLPVVVLGAFYLGRLLVIDE